MRSPIRLGIAILAMAALAGCGASQNLAPETPSNPGSPGAEEAEASQVVAESPDIVEDGLFEGLDETALAEDGGAGAGTLAPEELIHPLRYWRAIRSIERRFEFHFYDRDSTGRPNHVLVVLHKLLRGTFNIVTGEPTPADTEPTPSGDTPRDPSLDVIRKPLADHWIRRLVLERVRLDDAGAVDDTRPRRTWRIVGASGAEITSIVPDAKPTRILSLHIRTAGFETTITDPLALRRLSGVLKFEPEAEVGLTVTTERPDDVVVLMCRDRRFRLRSNGDNTYSGVWRAPLRSGFHHFGVNALAHGTLFDDKAPYSSQAWILHYVVRGGEPVAALEP